MDRKYVKHTGTFTAHSADGRRYTVDVFTEFIECRSQRGCEVVEGMKSLRTSDGQHVNRLDKGRYRTAGILEVDLVSDDPNAP